MSMRDEKVNFAGMVTAPGVLARSQASCVYQLNSHVEAPGILRKRNGFLSLPAFSIQPAKTLYSDALTGNQVYAHTGPDFDAERLQLGDGVGTAWADVNPMPLTEGSTTPQNLTRTLVERMELARGTNSLYATASEGTLRITQSGATAADWNRFAGMPRGMAPAIWYAAQQLSINCLQPGLLLDPGQGRAYRITWHLVLTNGTELGGAPTGRVEVENITDYPGYTGTGAQVRLTIPLPVELSTLNKKINATWFYRVWGTRVYTTAPVNTEDDQMFLVAERNVTASDLANGYAVYDDLTPDAFITGRAYLHTNTEFLSGTEAGEAVDASGKASGVLNEDAPPPLARAMAFWRDRMWYGGVHYRTRLQVRMVSIPDNGQGIVISNADGTTTSYGCFNSPVSALEFQRFTAFPTLMENIRATAQALCDAINLNLQTNATGVCAYYMSTSLSNAGLIYLENTVPAFGSTGTFVQLVCSQLGVFDGLSNATTANGSEDRQTNGLAFSKAYRPDACPPSFTLFVGGREEVILKMMPLKERLFIFTDQRVYAITGYGPQDFTVRPVANYRLLATQSVVQCDDRLFAWCREGIIELSESGTEIISLPIEPSIQGTIEALRAGGDWDQALTAMRTGAFAVASTDSHRVYFFTPTRGATNRYGCSRAYGWDTRTRTWGYNIIGSGVAEVYKGCGVARFDGAIVLGPGYPPSGTGYSGQLAIEQIFRNGAGDHVDSLDNLASVPVLAQCRFQWNIPAVDGAVHWQQSVMQFEGGQDETAWRTYPTEVGLRFATDHNWWVGVTPAAEYTFLSPVLGDPLVRYEVPLSCRRSNRLYFEVYHRLDEPFGLCAISISARDQVSKWARRTNNIPG